MASRISYRNTFRLVHGKKFWDQISTISSPKSYFFFRKFLSLHLKHFLRRFSLVLAHFYWIQTRNLFTIYLFLWRSLKFFKKGRVMKRWRRRIRSKLNVRLYWRKLRGVGKKEDFDDFYMVKRLSRWRRWTNFFFNYRADTSVIESRRTPLFFFKFKLRYSALMTVKNLKAKFVSRQKQKALLPFSSLWLNSGYYSRLFQHRHLLLISDFVNSSELIFGSLRHLKFKLWRKKKQWFLKLFFKMYMSRHIALFFLDLNKRFTYRVNCQIWDLADFWRTKFNIISALPEKQKVSFQVRNTQRRFFAGLLYASNRIGPKRKYYIWQSFILFFFFSKMSRNFNPLLSYIKWIFQSWQRKKQKVFFNFLRTVFMGEFYSYYIPQLAYAPVSFYIVFKGRVDGKHRARSFFLRVQTNAKPAFQNLSGDIIYYYRQFITKFGVYGVNVWAYNHKFTNTTIPVLKGKADPANLEQERFAI